MLAVIETHPVQYHAPVYQALQQECGIPVTAIYGSDFSVSGYRDKEFGTEFSWDTDLLSGYSAQFLSRVKEHGAASAESVSAAGLCAALAALKPSAVMLTGYGNRFNRQACLVAMRSRRPVLFRGETTDHAVARSALKSSLRDFALRAMYRRCAALMYVGERSAQHFARLGFARSRLFFSPYCVDASVFECGETAREKYRAPMRESISAMQDDLVLLFSGKLSHRKGPDLLVDAIETLPAELRSRIVLLFVGDGEFRAALEARCRPANPEHSGFRIGLSSLPSVPRAFFAGFKNQRELSPYFHAADALVLPSRQGETWGLVVNEALHHGISAIVSDAVGCAPDLVESGRTGETFTADSVAELAAALVRFARSRAPQTTREACRRKVAEFSIQRAASGVAEAFRFAARSPK